MRLPHRLAFALALSLLSPVARADLFGVNRAVEDSSQDRGLGLVRVDTETAAVDDVAPAVDSVNNTIQGITFSRDGNLYGVASLHVLDPATGAVRALRSGSSDWPDMRGVKEIIVPEPGGAAVGFACLAARVLRRRRCASPRLKRHLAA